MDREMADIESQTTYGATRHEEVPDVFHKRKTPVTLKVLSLNEEFSNYDYYLPLCMHF